MRTFFLTGLMLLTMITGAVDVVRDGKSDYVIVIPKEASEPVKHASAALQKLIRELSGAELPVVVESGTTKGIHLGPTAGSREVIADSELGKVKNDGVIIRCANGSVFLRGGNARGEIYAVYELAERFWGVRFLTDEVTHYPESPTLSLDDRLNHIHQPSFLGREILYPGAYGQEISLAQHLNGDSNHVDESVGGKISIRGVHTMFNYLPPGQYFDEHPEYYSLRNGKRIKDSWDGAQLCLTNPEVLSIVIANFLKYIEAHPELKTIDLSQMDSGTGGTGCECEKCLALNLAEGSPSGAVIIFVNAVAEQVAAKYPDVTISTLAYQHTTKPPKTVVPRGNVIIRLCHRGCYNHGLACPVKSFTMPGHNKVDFTTRTDLEGWRKIAKRIHIWHYAVNYFGYFSPNPYLIALGEDIKYYAAQGCVEGLMIQCNWQSPGGELAELRQYLIAQLLWDSSRDPQQIRDEFVRLYYGAAAPEVMTFLKLLDQEAARRDIHPFAYWQGPEVTRPQFLNQAMDTLEKAAAKAGSGELKNRIDLLLLPYYYLQLTWPDFYTRKNDPAQRLAIVKEIIARNHITHYAEGGDARIVEAWLKRIEEAAHVNP